MDTDVDFDVDIEIMEQCHLFVIIVFRICWFCDHPCCAARAASKEASRPDSVIGVGNLINDMAKVEQITHIVAHRPFKMPQGLQNT